MYRLYNRSVYETVYSYKKLGNNNTYGNSYKLYKDDFVHPGILYALTYRPAGDLREPGGTCLFVLEVIKTRFTTAHRNTRL